MDKSKLVSEIKRYFKIQEFVDETTFSKWGENAWNFIDNRLIETIIVVRRDILKVPLVCNDWCFGGSHKQRGLRTNLSVTVKEKTDKGVLYLTQHSFGKAVDFVSSKMTAEKMRELIRANQSKLPYPIRMETGTSWLHIDVMEMVNQTTKIYEFKG